VKHSILNRRLVAVLLVVVAPIGGFVAAARSTIEPATTPTFANLSAPSMPFVPHLGFLNSTWFCAGVPNTGNGLGGSVVVANPLDVALVGHLTLFTDAKDVAPVEADFEVPPRDTYTQEITELQTQGNYVSAMVEIAGGGGFVEQIAEHSDGDAVSPCTNSTSSSWYFADNYTLGDSKEDLVITNPFPDDAIVDFTFAFPDQGRSPGHRFSRPHRRCQGAALRGRAPRLLDEPRRPVAVHRLVLRRWPEGRHELRAVQHLQPR
jgi:hypothetical protein